MREFWERTYRETYYPNVIDAGSATPLEVGAGKEVRADIQIVRLAGVRVAGHVAVPPGQPAQSGPVPRWYTNVALIAAGQRSGNATAFSTTQDGAFEFLDVLPGRYTLQALTREIPTNLGSMREQKPIWAAVKEVEVSDKGVEGVIADLEPLAELAGVVTFQQGCTPEPLEIHAQVISSVFGGPSMPAASPGPDGKFVLTGLAPTHYTIHVQTKGGLFAGSAKLGELDVQRNGFDVPLNGNAILQIQMNCSFTGRAR